jgi:hypothetical protein
VLPASAHRRGVAAFSIDTTIRPMHSFKDYEKLNQQSFSAA